MNLMMRHFTLSFLFLFLASLLGAQTVYSIAEARRVDSGGVMEHLDEEVILEGIAIGPNFRPGGQTFSILDVVDGVGINVFSVSDPVGYEVTDGDKLRITGVLGQFNGLEQITPSSIEILSQGESLPEARAVTVLNETTQSYLVKLENVMLVDINQWPQTGSFNVDVTDGTNTYAIRVDSDTDIPGNNPPMGTFTITGIGGQFDQDSPFLDGYQLFPRSVADISPYNGMGGNNDYTVVTMQELRANDANGIPMMNGQKVEVTAITYGLNRRDEGLQFTIINDDNVGVAIFNPDEDLGYTVTEGDMITVQGTLGHFNGLTQLTPDVITLVSSDNDLVTARLVERLDESTESSLVYIEPVDVEDAAQWLGDGTSFNVNFLNNTGEVMTVRIEDQTDLSSEIFKGTLGTWYFGIGGQFDSSDPRDEGYQLLPRYLQDVQFYLSTEDFYTGEISISPNPASDMVTFSADEEINSIQLMDINGQLITKTTQKILDVSRLPAQMYVVKVQFDSSVYVQRLVVE